MPMNNRLMRPRQTLHPEALDWRNRVVANGGSVSGTTLNAVDRFVKAIHAAGIRDRFYRLNLFCGVSDGSLNAVRTPLFRGPSLTGTQFGGAMDTNFNFVQGDYAETGASGGLTGNGSSKYLGTGFNVSDLPGAANCHLSAYIAGTQNATGTMSLVGALFNGVADRYRIFLGPHTVGNYSVSSELGKATQATVGGRANANGGLLLSSRVSATLLEIYDDAVSIATNTSSTAETTGSVPFLVFARSGPTEYYNGRMAGYSIGAGLTASGVTSYYNALNTFQTALGRAQA